jgi:hypothetical protein
MPADLKFFPERLPGKLSYDEQRKVLKTEGKLAEDAYEEIIALTADTVFKQALKSLSRKNPGGPLKAKERYMFIPVGRISGG